MNNTGPMNIRLPHCFAKMSCLLAQIKNASLLSKAKGTLVSFASKFEAVQDGPIKILVGHAENLLHKPPINSQLSESKKKSPFLPPFEDGLFVTSFDQYNVLLNKYNVVDNHILLTSKDFISQLTPLTSNDFRTVWHCVSELDGLAFFNRGPNSGMSQPHKHLQIIPRKHLFNGIEQLYPVDELVSNTINRSKPDKFFQVQELPFDHSVCNLAHYVSADATLSEKVNISKSLSDIHQQQLKMLDIDESSTTASFNMLMSKDFMMLIPRTQESIGEVSINALGYLGSIFVKTPQDFKYVKEVGPLEVLSLVGRPKQTKH